MKLIYTGKTIDEVGIVPLPEGWPAEDHDEPDESLWTVKLASGKYRMDDSEVDETWTVTPRHEAGPHPDERTFEDTADAALVTLEPPAAPTTRRGR